MEQTTTLTNEQKKERPILFSTEMVQAILEGRKTQTRRVVKFPLKSPTHHISINDSDSPPIVSWCPYGKPGDILWVRESFVYRDKHDTFYYKADHTESEPYAHNGWKPSIHMPRKACRLFLEITDIKIERLQDISQTDAKAEGVRHIIDKITGYCGYDYENGGYNLLTYPYHGFRSLWKIINGEESWNLNPWVWVIEFTKTQQPHP